MTLAKAFAPGLNFSYITQSLRLPTNPAAALQSQDTCVPIAVAKLGWGKRAGVECACSVSSCGARRPRPQASQAWLRHPVFQAQARREGGRGRGGKGREGRAGEGQSGPLCVCVFVCAHVGDPHNVLLVCLASGGS